MSKLRATLVTMLVLAVGLFVYSPVAFAGHGQVPGGPNIWHSDTMTINETGSLGLKGTEFVPAWVRTDCDTPVVQGLSQSDPTNVNATGCHAFAEEVLDAWLSGGWWDPRGGTEFIPPSGDHHRAGWRLMLQSHFSAGQWLTGFAPLADIFPFYPQVGLKGAGETPIGVYELCIDPEGAAVNDPFSPVGAPDLSGPLDGSDNTVDIDGIGGYVPAVDNAIVADCRAQARAAGVLLLEFVDHHGEPLTPGRFPRYIPHERNAWVSTLVTKYTASPSTNVDSTVGVNQTDANGDTTIDENDIESDITGARISQVFRTQHNFVSEENQLIQEDGVAVWFSMSDESGNGCAGGWCKWSWDPISNSLCRAYAGPGNDTVESVCGYAGATNVKSAAAIHDQPVMDGPGYEAESVGDMDGVCENGEPCDSDPTAAVVATGDDDGVCEAAETDCYGNPLLNVLTAAVEVDLNGDTDTLDAGESNTGFQCNPGDFCRRDINNIEKAPAEIYQVLGQWVQLGNASGAPWSAAGSNQALWTEFWGLSGPNFQSEEGINPNTWLKCGDPAGTGSPGDVGCNGAGTGPLDSDWDLNQDGDTADAGEQNRTMAITVFGLDVVNRWGEDMRPDNAADLGCIDADGDGFCNESATAGSCTFGDTDGYGGQATGADGICDDDQDCGLGGAIVQCTDGAGTATVICIGTGGGDDDPRTADCSSVATDAVYGNGDDGLIYYKEVVEESLRGFLRHNRTIAFSFSNGAQGNGGSLNGTQRQIMAQSTSDGMTLSCMNCEGSASHYVRTHRVPSYHFSFDVNGVDFVEHDDITPGSGIIP